MGQVKEYGIGLDIGVTSIGFSAVDAQGNLLSLKRKKVLGTYLFSEGQTAAPRRLARTTRRRLKRTRRRLCYLQDFFQPEINKIDPEFFLRLKYSSLSPKDHDHVQYPKGLFNDRRDKEYYDDYPTIYHLRNKLMTEQRQFDLREVFLAIHHIMKNRGHFLTEGNAKNFNPTEIDFKTSFETLDEAYQALLPDTPVTFTEISGEAFEAIVLDRTSTRADRKKRLVALLLDAQPAGSPDKALKRIFAELSNAVLGFATKINVLVNEDVDDADEWKTSFDIVDDYLEDNGDQLSAEGLTVVETLRQLYQSILLAGIMPAGKSFSQSKVDDYCTHQNDLKQFKAYLATLPDAATKRSVRSIYDRYISGTGDTPATVQDKFYKELTAAFAKHENALSKEMQTRIDQGVFMPKLRTKANSIVPYQVQQHEMDVIIENQAKYYPFLKEPNPVVEHRSWAATKLDELLTFRLPYYNGPAITDKEQEKSSGAHFAWMVRKSGETGEITPWNYEQKVDRSKTAEQFIKRMQTTDTYLVGESVLPKQSLLYQRFEVLNELNMVRADNHLLSRAQKQGIYEHLFKQHRSVRIKQVQEYLVHHGDFQSAPAISGLAGETAFLSSLSTYNELKQVFGQAIDDPQRRADIELIIGWATVFEDSQIVKEKLESVDWLTPDQRRRLSNKRYRGWGQFSEKFLSGLPLSNGHTIIEELWDKQTNLMQILTDDGLKQAIEKANDGKLTPDTVNALLDDAYTSPSNKKAIRKVVRLVNDIVRANGGVPPKWLFLETADGAQKRPQRPNAREKQIEQAYQQAGNLINPDVFREFKEKQKSHADFRNDKLFLYFLQNGIDLYTGHRINIEEPSNYDIDHIIPQAITKDDSLNNRVLVSAKANREKADRLAYEVFGAKMMPLWLRLYKGKLISGGKFANLTLRQNKLADRAEGFIARQLVETRQIIKLTEQVIRAFYPDTKIVAVKAGLSHQFREEFNLPKNRDVNDYHHAFDALLASWIGLYLLNRYPKLSEFFVYGDFTKADYKKLRQFNFIKELSRHHGGVTDDNGELLWGGPKAIETLRHVYEYKKIITVHEVTDHAGQLFKQTVYPANQAKERGGKRSLIPTKADRPASIYGGYTHEEMAYMAIARTEDKKGNPSFKVLSVPVRKLQWLRQQQSEGKSEILALSELFEPEFTSYKGKVKKKAVTPFRIILPHVHIDQLFWSPERGYYMLRSSVAFHNFQQLWLSITDQRTLLQASQKNNDVTSSELTQVYQDIYTQISAYFPLYDNRGFRNKLSDSVHKFDTVEGATDHSVVEAKLNLINRVLIGLHADQKTSKLPELNIPTDFGKLMLSGGITLSADTELIQQSPSGLFERRLRLADL
ncbi:type II CRISPR RNA-guided endonuclease Cas9 [Lacticaseibacillus nasuensis]|uniref:type II CRISPR RNA-guided endonuclease Cas9 n=1 Tax=Lacticaseibacillus nasuensis TaxID=944671 RepID=UPI0022456929|nr:type II CRISPR RNA-guided endonuclease Cas9 [Lacticaseibacillus nasuensis]MCX2455100.1 type II CRISPR RNA-guided endonuclease Cas9 [Lacticaseibacillus nasuensis]